MTKTKVAPFYLGHDVILADITLSNSIHNEFLLNNCGNYFIFLKVLGLFTTDSKDFI